MEGEPDTLSRLFMCVHDSRARLGLHESLWAAAAAAFPLERSAVANASVPFAKVQKPSKLEQGPPQLTLGGG